MAAEDDSSSVNEDLDEHLNFQELIEHVANISTKIRRKKENLEEFVSSMNNENSVNKTVLKRFQAIEDDFKEGRKTKSELKDLQKKLSERIKEVNEKLQRIQNALEYITSKELQIKDLHEEISNLSEKQDELVKVKYEIQSLFSEIKIKFRESKKVKLSLLTKFKPDDLIQSVKSWEKAAETAREINRKVAELQKEIEVRSTAMGKLEKELQEERKKSSQHEDDLLRLVDDMKNEEDSKKEQSGLINNFRSLLDESEKLARNLEAQNKNLNQIIGDEKERVTDLRNKLTELQEQIDNERKRNREMSLQHEHMRAGFLAATAENEGYARDMAAIRKELDAIKALQDRNNVRKKEAKEDDDETLSDQIEELEEKLEISDKMLHAKYLETETLQTDLDRTSERVTELETKVTVMNENVSKMTEKVEVRDREVAQLTELLKDTQTALESEKLAKDEYIIKCELIERKLALMEMEGSDERDGRLSTDDMEKEIEDLREKLEEERLKVADKIALVEELEVQLVASEELREYEEDIKTRSIENIVQAEMENRKLKQIVEELREKLSEKDSGIEELIAHCAVEELKLREEIAGLTNQLQVYKRDCVYKANIIERLRRKIESQRTGLGILNEEDEEESEADLLVRTAALERKLHEERLKIEKYEGALIALNKQCEENEDTIRDKDYELSRKSAEDGKRIAELLQELESDKKSIMELDEQIENLEDILSLKEAIEKLEDESEEGDRAQMEKELQDMKEDYAFKKLRRRDDLIQEMRTFIEELRTQLKTEQERLRKNEDLIADLNDSSVQDLKKIDKLTKKIAKLEEETTSQKEYIEKLTQKITEGQRLIAQLEGVADRERMRVATIEQLLQQEKQDYSKHLVGVEDLKQKVDDYQTNVSEIREKVERINKNIAISPRDEYGSSTASHLEDKLKAQKNIIKELRANVSAVEEKSQELGAELRDQKGKNVEQDEKIDSLLKKTLECEDLVEFMKRELELVRKRYRGLSGLPEEETPDKLIAEEEIREERQPQFEAAPLFGYFDDEKEHDGDDEEEESESDAFYSCEDQDDKTRQSTESKETRQREIIRQLLVFEKVFEKIFSEEGNRIDIVIKKFERVMEKNTELITSLQNVRQTLNEARKESERKEEQIEQMKEEFLSIKEELDETKSTNERIRNVLEEEGERAMTLSGMLTDEQVKGIAAEEKATIMQKLLEDQQQKIDALEAKLSEEILRVNQLKESLSVEQLIKIEYEREIEVLKSKVLEEQESSEFLREELERETNTKFEFDGRIREIEEEASNRATIIDELQKDLETERKCYSIVTERLQVEQEKLIELEKYVKDAEESATHDKSLLEELRENISLQERQKNDFIEKLQKFEKESSEKDEEIGSLVDQLGAERNRMEELIGEIDLEKMGKTTAESKLKELEEYLSKDEQIFEELRRNIDSESAKNRELSDLLDQEQERNAELEEKAKELEKQVLMDLELFEELKNTIEQERAHNRELDALLNEKNSAFNNRDKLLSELDSELTELRAVLQKEKFRNDSLIAELQKKSGNEEIIHDLQDMLKSQIIRSEQLDAKTQKLEQQNREQSEKIEALEKALSRLKELSAEISKELTDDLQAWGQPIDDIEESGAVDFNGNYDYTDEKDALRFKALLNNELTIKKTLMSNVEEYKNKLEENDLLLSELKEILRSEQKRLTDIESAAEQERQQKEETKSLMKTVESELELKRQDADSLRADFEKVNLLYTNMMKENEQKKVEVEVLSKEIEDKDTKQQQFIQELRENMDKMEAQIKEKEEEGEMLRTYFEEEHKFAQDRLEQNQQLKKQLEDMETKLKDNEIEIKNLLHEKADLASSLEKTISKFAKQREILVDELKEKTRKHNDKVEYIKELQKTVEDLSYSHRRSKDKTEKSNDKKTPTDDTKLHLKEIEDEFDSLEVELTQKDEEIARLRKALEDNNNNTSTQSTEIQKEVDRLRLLAEEHKDRAGKAIKALEKARLLRQLLQTELDIKTSTIDQLKRDGAPAHFSTSDSSGIIQSSKKNETVHLVKNKDVTSTADDTVDGGKSKQSAETEKIVSMSKDKENEIVRLREQLSSIQTTMDKEKTEKENILKQKNKELEEQSKTIDLVRNMYQVLQYEAKREKILQDVLPSENTSLEDAKLLYKDLENRLQSLKDEVTEKATTIINLKHYIEEIKAKHTDKSLLDRKMNIHRLLSVQLKEKEKKLHRLENLLQHIEKMYGKNITETKSIEAATPDGIECKDNEMEEKNKQDGEERTNERDGEVERIIEATNCEPLQGSIPLADSRNESQDATDSPVFPKEAINVSANTFIARISPPKQSSLDPKDLPKSGWKVKLLLYIAIAIGLGLLPQFLKIKTLKIVLACVVTPLFFILSIVEVKVYRKKIENFVRRNMGVKYQGDVMDQSHSMALVGQDETIVESLRQELQSLMTNKEVPMGNDEVDDLFKQQRKVEDLEKTIRKIEISKLEEQEKNKRSFDEYIKLREDVDELKRRRDMEAKSEFFGFKKFTTATSDGDLGLVSVRPRSLPLWVALSVGVYYLTTLHSAAPCAAFLLVSLFAVNSWFKIKTIKTKLVNEREVIREQNEELEDITELLEQEHNVVEAQKAAMEIMQREIDNEYVSRKAKSLTLAKMIIEVKELEEMRRAMHEENLVENQDPELKAAVQNVSKEKADEKVRLFVEMSRKLPEPDSLSNSEAVEDINETVEDIAAEAQSMETGALQDVDTNLPKKTNPKLKLIAMAATGSAAFAASLILKYYLPALLIAIQLVLIIQLFIKHKLLKLSEQVPVTQSELQTQLNKEKQKNKANRQQIGKLKRLLDTEKSFKKSDECAKEIKKRVSDRAAKRKQL